MTQPTADDVQAAEDWRRTPVEPCGPFLAILAILAILAAMVLL